MTVPSAARLEAIQTMAEVAETALPLNASAIFMTPEGVLGIAKPPRPSKLKFTVDGLTFNLAVTFDGTESVCQILAEVGHIPYTAQSPERRRNILSVVRAMQEGPRTKLLVQEGQKILLFSEERLEGHASPEDLIHQTILALQEARPFLKILARYL